MTSLIDRLKSFEDENTHLMVSGGAAAEFTGTIDTGSYMMNAVLSGSIYGGVADNKITAFAGEEATGKTFFALGVVRTFLQSDPNNIVIYYDTEAAVTREMMSQRGIDVNRVLVAEPSSIEEFRTMCLRHINMVVDNRDRKEAGRALFVLDSLGNMPTKKEIADIEAGTDKRDMTRSQLIRGAFRVLTLKLAHAKIPLIVTNHVYDNMNAMFPSKEITGGGGLKYAASTICVFGKSKERDGTDIVGNVIRVKMDKSRLSRENKVASVLLHYDRGLDRYYGLVDIALKYGIFQKAPKHVILPDGSKHFEKAIYKNPEKYLDPYLDKIELACNKEFMYGVNDPNVDDVGQEEEEVEE